MWRCYRHASRLRRHEVNTFIPTALACFPRSASTPISRLTQKMYLVKRGASSFLTLFQNLDKIVSSFGPDFLHPRAAFKLRLASTMPPNGSITRTSSLISCAAQPPLRVALVPVSHCMQIITAIPCFSGQSCELYSRKQSFRSRQRPRELGNRARHDGACRGILNLTCLWDAARWVPLVMR